MTNEFELDDLADFYGDELGAQDWVYQGKSEAVKVIFEQADSGFVAYVMASSIEGNPNTFDRLIDPNGKVWFVKGWEKFRYYEYRIDVTDEPPLNGVLQRTNYQGADDAGILYGFEDICNIEVFVDPFSGDTTVFEQLPENYTQYNVKILYTEDISQNHVITLEDGRILYIQSLLNPHEFKKGLILACYSIEDETVPGSSVLPGKRWCATDICNNSNVDGANVAEALDNLNTIFQVAQDENTTDNINSVTPVPIRFDVLEKSSSFIENTNATTKTILEAGAYLIGFHVFATKTSNGTTEMCADIFINDVQTDIMITKDTCGPNNDPGCTLGTTERRIEFAEGDEIKIKGYRIGGNVNAVNTFGKSTYLTIQKVG